MTDRYTDEARAGDKTAAERYREWATGTFGSEDDPLPPPQIDTSDIADIRGVLMTTALAAIEHGLALVGAGDGTLDDAPVAWRADVLLAEMMRSIR